VADFRSLVSAVSAVAAAGGRSWLSPKVRPLDEVCTAFAHDLPVSGVSVSVLSGKTIRETVGSSDVLADKIEDEQYALGVGPCYDAFARGGPVLVPDLRDSAENRWPAFSTALAETPVRAIFAFPLHLGGVVVGAVDTYRTEPGLLNAADLRDLLRAVDLLVVALASARGSGLPEAAALTIGAGETAPGFADDRRQTDLDVAGTAALRSRSTGWEDFLDGLPSDRIKVHQATGMVIAQLGGTPEQALARIRAYAFANNRTMVDVAADLVARRLILPT
jgi:GAF domain-containing protein